jgi:nitric oxide reductase large subunit
MIAKIMNNFGWIIIIIISISQLIHIAGKNCRLEKVKLSCLYSKVKIVGTLLCVVGALTMSIMHSTADEAKQAQLSSPSPSVAFDTQKIIGCLYLVAAVFILSANVVLQVTLTNSPICCR